MAKLSYQLGYRRVTVAIVPGWADITPGEHEANKNLFCAAPDLLAACNALLRCYDYGHSTTSKELSAAADSARIAIAKAKGGAK